MISPLWWQPRLSLGSSLAASLLSVGRIFFFCVPLPNYSVLAPAVTAAVTSLDRLDAGFSLFLVITTASMFGPNLAGAIEQKVSSSYVTYKAFTGSGYLAGALALLALKVLLVQSLTKKI